MTRPARPSPGSAPHAGPPPVRRLAPARRPGGSTRVRRAGADDEGAGSVELVLATPLIMIMLLVVVQLALWGWAEQVAAAAARRGVAAARLNGADAQVGQTTARLITSQLGGHLLDDPQIGVTTPSPTLITVTVTGTAIRYLPGLALHVTARASGTRETYRP